MVSILTVVPDLMRSAGAMRAEKYPHTTVSGREPSVTSGLVGAGTDCAAADATRAATPAAVHQATARPRTHFDIGSILPRKYRAQDSIGDRPVVRVFVMPGTARPNEQACSAPRPFA